MKLRLLLALLFFATPYAAHAQSSPGLYNGQVPTAAQWNSYFAAKQDYLGYTPVNKAGDTMQGPLITQTPTSSAAGLNLPPGVAPGAPHDGDLWTTTGGIFARINGVTQALGSNSTSTNTVNKNTGSLIAPQTGTLYQGQQADGVVARSELDAFGAAAHFTGVVEGGTRASPTAVASGADLASLNSYAYNGSAIVGPIASLRMYAGENIASGHQGSKVCLATTPIAGTTLANQLCVFPDGGIVIGSPTGGDIGAGSINVPMGFYVNGVANGLSAIAANSVLANFSGSSATPGASVLPTCGDATHALGYAPGSPGAIYCQAITATASAGGSTTQVQRNNAGALGGISGVTSNGTTMTFGSGDLLASNIVNTGTLTLPTSTDTLVGRATTDTLSGKSMDGGSNTFTNIANASLTNSSLTFAGHTVSLGGSSAIAASDLSNGVTGSGSIVLAASPTLTGTLTASAATFGSTVSISGTTTLNAITFNSPSGARTALGLQNGATTTIYETSGSCPGSANTGDVCLQY